MHPAPVCRALLRSPFQLSPGVISPISHQRFITHSVIRSPVASPVGFRGVCLPGWTPQILHTNLEIPGEYNRDTLPGLVKIDLQTSSPQQQKNKSAKYNFWQKKSELRRLMANRKASKVLEVPSATLIYLLTSSINCQILSKIQCLLFLIFF